MSVSLDGQEAELLFIDHPSTEMSVGSAVLYCTVLYCTVCTGGEHGVDVRASGLRGGLLRDGPAELRPGRGHAPIPRLSGRPRLQQAEGAHSGQSVIL